jgi:predicted DNA binding CopG/RHH family protein
MPVAVPQRRDRNFPLRTSSDERELIRSAAAAHGLPMAELIREALRRQGVALPRQ